MEVNTKNSINLEYLRLMADNDVEMIQTMLTMLLEELPEEMGKIRDLAAAKNWEELTRVSHKMKSTLAFVGNDAMTSANKDLERISKNQTDLALVPSLVHILDSHLPAVVQALEKAAEATQKK